PGETAPVIRWCGEHQRSVTHIICTHHHYDHVDGIEELLQVFPVQEVLCSPVDLPRIRGATRPWSEGEPVIVCGVEAKSMMIPGHTQGHMAIYLRDLGWLFCGDTIFGMG